MEKSNEEKMLKYLEEILDKPNVSNTDKLIKWITIIGSVLALLVAIFGYGFRFEKNKIRTDELEINKAEKQQVEKIKRTIENQNKEINHNFDVLNVDSQKLFKLSETVDFSSSEKK